MLLGVNANVGQIAATCAVNTSVSAAAGGIASLFVHLYQEERKTGEVHFDLTAAMNGALSGLVSITAACATVDPWAAALTGAVSGIVYLSARDLLIHFKIDDVVDAIPVHFASGLWGMIAVGLFSTPSALKEVYGLEDHAGWCYSWGNGSGDATLLFSQIVACFFIIGWSTLTMGPFFFLLQHLNWFRSDNLDELLGLDQMYHGGIYNEGSQNSNMKQQLGYIRGLLSDPSVSSQQSGK